MKFETVEIPAGLGGRGAANRNEEYDALLDALRSDSGKAQKIPADSIASAKELRGRIIQALYTRRHPEERLRTYCLPDGLYLWLEKRGGEGR